VSTDTHTSSPRHGVHSQHAGVDERQATYGPARRGRLATVEGEAAEAPLTWARDSGVMPTVSRTPRLRQMLGVCGWAALLGAVGLVVGVRGFIADLMSTTPGWYEPVMIGAGAIGIGLTVGAFATVHRRRMPYILLSAATVTLAYATLLTVTAI
jgi:hypothetical protein